MKKENLKRNVVLSILFFLPVAFLLMLYPSKNNYEPLDIVNSNVVEVASLETTGDEVQLKDHITILGFLGLEPDKNQLAMLNLKEVIYDKFLGFKKFQVIILVPKGLENEVAELEQELITIEPLKYWHFVYANEDDISRVFKSLKAHTTLNENLALTEVFVIDSERNQRGRLDDRTKKEIEKNLEEYPLYHYDCIQVSELKNKLAKEDMRVLFTEYREKRKGKFDSTTRRANDIK